MHVLKVYWQNPGPAYHWDTLTDNGSKNSFFLLVLADCKLLCAIGVPGLRSFFEQQQLGFLGFLEFYPTQIIIVLVLKEICFLCVLTGCLRHTRK